MKIAQIRDAYAKKTTLSKVKKVIASLNLPTTKDYDYTAADVEIIRIALQSEPAQNSTQQTAGSEFQPQSKTLQEKIEIVKQVSEAADSVIKEKITSQLAKVIDDRIALSDGIQSFIDRDADAFMNDVLSIPARIKRERAERLQEIDLAEQAWKEVEQFRDNVLPILIEQVDQSDVDDSWNQLQQWKSDRLPQLISANLEQSRIGQLEGTAE